MSIKKPLVEIVLPIYNEEKELKANTVRLVHFLQNQPLPFSWNITIVDNASTDKSGVIGRNLEKQYNTISYIYLKEKGRGRAVKYAWKKKIATFYAYMDIDLSTNLDHFPQLVKTLIGGYDISIGSRLLAGSKVQNRPFKREILSRCYNLIIKIFFQTHFSDAQCGFKGVNKKVVDYLLPHIKDNEWFFDSELLIIAEKAGYKIFEVPVNWVDNPGSTVRVLKTVTGDLAGLWRIFTTAPWRHL